MHKVRIQIIALCLMALSLIGCEHKDFFGYLDETYGYYETVAYSDMEYTRPDMTEIQNTLTASCAVVQNSESLEEVLDAIYDFYDVYDRFYTDCNLANIRYCCALTDTYWGEEYNFCMENAPVMEAGLEELYCVAAVSPVRDELESEEYFGAGYFDAYEGENFWDDSFLDLMEQEAKLESQYYGLFDLGLSVEYYSDEYFSVYGRQMAELFVELVEVRQEIAAYAGYSSYPEFAYDYYFYRDYTPAQMESYLSEISETLYDAYYWVNQSDVWELTDAYCGETDTFQYVKDASAAMGGTIGEAFELLEKAELYDISYGENKYDASFEVYLWSYYEPFIFMNPYMNQTDKLTFAHEFGHFLNDYANSGSYGGTDILEVHSQAFEYLSLCYGKDTNDLTKRKMADSLCVYMEQAAYTLFEHQVYSLMDADLTVDNVMALYENIGYQFGFDSWNWDSRDFVTVSHLFTDPMYVASYVVSNDLALQIYQRELEDPGAGLKLYEKCLNSEESYIIYFAELCELESPFAEGRLQEAAEMFQEFFAYPE